MRLPQPSRARLAGDERRSGAFRFTPTLGAKPGRTGKRNVASRGCAMMFTVLWLTDARPELFPVMIWLAFGLLGAK